MSTQFGEIVLRLFKVQIIEYLSSIYDYFNIILTCKSMKFEYYSKYNVKMFSFIFEDIFFLLILSVFGKDGCNTG